MNVTEYAAHWVRGEVFQGKIMLSIGILVLLVAIAIFRSQHELLKGMLVPMALMMIIMLGYGSFLTFGRPAHLPKVAAVYQQNPEKAVQMELEKSLKDHKTYSSLKIVWPILLVLSVLFYLFVSQEWYKGLGIGLAALFVVALLVDSLLHYRLEVYMKALSSLASES